MGWPWLEAAGRKDGGRALLATISGDGINGFEKLIERMPGHNNTKAVGSLP